MMELSKIFLFIFIILNSAKCFSSKHFEISSDCDNYLSPEVVREVELNLDDHFYGKLVQTIPSHIKLEQTALYNHRQQWEDIKWRKNKVNIWCLNPMMTQFKSHCGDKTAAATDIEDNIYFCRQELEIIESEYNLKKYLFHEIYHLISGGHFNGFPDYTIACEITQYSSATYLNHYYWDKSEYNYIRDICTMGKRDEIFATQYIELLVKKSTNFESGSGFYYYWISSIDKLSCSKFFQAENYQNCLLYKGQLDNLSIAKMIKSKQLYPLISFLIPQHFNEIFSQYHDYALQMITTFMLNFNFLPSKNLGEMHLKIPKSYQNICPKDFELIIWEVETSYLGETKIKLIAEKIKCQNSQDLVFTLEKGKKYKFVINPQINEDASFFLTP